MKYRLLLLSICPLSFASTLTVDLSVRENAEPSRHASLVVGDGLNSLFVDLYRTSAYLGPITPIGFSGCPSACVFTPVGDLTATFVLPEFGNSLVLGGVGVPSVDLNDYSVWFSMNFTPGSGSGILDADLNIAITQISDGMCVFCAHAPFGTATYSESSSIFPTYYPDYRFAYHASGETVPEPDSWQLALTGMAILAAAGFVKRRRELGMERRDLVPSKHSQPSAFRVRQDHRILREN